MDADHPAPDADAAHLPRQRDQAQAAAIQNVIIGHGGASSVGLGTTHNGVAATFLSDLQVSRLLGETTA